MARRKVVITGAAGYIAGRMLADLQERYDLVLLDVKTTNRDDEDVNGVIVTDLLNRDRDAYREHFKGVDAVVHCGFVRRSQNDVDATFTAEMNNVAMAYNVYQTCVEEGVRRAVVVSSNNAANYYERLIWGDKMMAVNPDMIPLAVDFYGWAKAAYELLGFTYAVGSINEGRRLENVQLRIGAPRETDIDACRPEDLKRMHRALGAYQSVRDQVQLVVKSIEAENIEDENGIPFQVFYGISGNTLNFWSLANARKVIGYEPEDDSLVRFADKVSEVILKAREGSCGGSD